jgi:hypothetical protein
VRVFIDPVSGEMRAPTAAELADGSARSAVPARAAVKAAPGVVVTPLPGGITEYDLGAATQIEETVCVQPDNSLGECTAAQKAQLRAGTKPDRQ